MIQPTRITNHPPILRLPPHRRLRSPAIRARLRPQFAATRFPVFGEMEGTHGFVGAEVETAGVAVVEAVGGFSPEGG